MGKPKKTASKTYRVVISDTALLNIDEITGYIAFIKREPLNAIKVGDATMETIERIGQNPLAFRECDELPTKSKVYRRAVCHSWLIIYKITGLEIKILSVVHGSRRPLVIKKLRQV